MTSITLPPGQYQLPAKLKLGSMSLREGRHFVVAGAFGALENDVLNLLQPNVLRQNPLTSAAPKGG
jgi:hypothetical protein